ncbi:MAG: hypothetical protein BWY91_00920 [bacterium ADurb.BinA028]|nr:MAG: hypothetical protein BWY91_00920 [bacterium ADurb.BinA028]
MQALNKVLIVWLKTRCLGQSTQDEELSTKVTRQEGMEEGAARVTRELMSKQTLPIRRLHKQASKYQLTSSFEGFGPTRLIVASLQPAIEERLRWFRERHALLVQEFVDHYDDALVAEQIKHGPRFRASDYPDKSQVAEKFSIEWGFTPLAMPSQFQESLLSEELRTQLQSQYAAQAQAAIANIESESIANLLRLVRSVADELSKPKPVLVDSENRKGVIPRLREAIAMLPQHNLTGNATIESLAAACNAQLTLATEALRDSEYVRTATATAARSILSQFGSYGARMVEAA